MLILLFTVMVYPNKSTHIVGVTIMDLPALLNRMKLWNSYSVVYADSRVYGCSECHDRKKGTQLRETPHGELCIECFLSLPPCSSCSTNIGVVQFAGQILCDECLNPSIPKDPELELYNLVYWNSGSLLYEAQIARLAWHD